MHNLRNFHRKCQNTHNMCLSSACRLCLALILSSSFPCLILVCCYDCGFRRLSVDCFHSGLGIYRSPAFFRLLPTLLWVISSRFMNFWTDDKLRVTVGLFVYSDGLCVSTLFVRFHSTNEIQLLTFITRNVNFRRRSATLCSIWRRSQVLSIHYYRRALRSPSLSLLSRSRSII